MTLANNPMFEDTTIDLAALSDHAQVVYTVRRLTAQMGFEENEQYLIATAASEASTNVIRYAEKGKVTLRAVVDGDRVGFEFTVEDHGPGIEDMEVAMEEGVSNGKGLGLGLSSIKRIMDEFDIQSKPKVGTRIVARKWRRNAQD